MHHKTLKESAGSLSVLVLDADAASRAQLHDSLKHTFKEIFTAATPEDINMVMKASMAHLTLINLDTLEEPFAYVPLLQRHDPFHPVIALTSRHDDMQLLRTYIDHALCGLIPLPLQKEEHHTIMVRTLAKVTHRVYENLVLLHYVESLESQHTQALDVSCKSDCPMAATLKKPLAPLATITPPDDFAFFPVSIPAPVAAPTVDHSIYRDYFSLLQSDDKEELLDQLSDIDAAHAMAFPNGDLGDVAAIARLGNSLMRFGNVLFHYQFFCDMGTAILELGKMLQDEADKVAQNASTLELFVSGFCSVLQNYMNDVWEVECANPKFFNDSIINDAALIIAQLTPAPASTASDDDSLLFF